MKWMRAEEQDWVGWEEQFARFLVNGAGHDAAHDHGHVLRVVGNAKALAAAEGARWEVVVPAAWLHDCVAVPKDSSQRPHASRLAAEKAAAFLVEAGYPTGEIQAIKHAIVAHSYAAQIAPQTVEAMVVQDADRLDALGAVGIARCFIVGGHLGLQLYDLDEPFPEVRTADDKRFIVDHFFAKLFRLAEQMNTRAGRREADRRTAVMRRFLAHLDSEIKGKL